jgi:creatinine amidohydrolase/Fe(II)-dependent formamide hydrolase-like protein
MERKMKGVFLEDLTWIEAKERFEAGALILIPVGAAAKAHGPHLPLKSDALTARALAERVLARLPLVAAPVLSLGYYPAFTRFAGSQHLGIDTFRNVVSELLHGFAAQGARRFALLNTGVSTERPLEEAAASRGDTLVMHMRLTGSAVDSLIDNKEGGHADERETSVMLALEPRSVRMDKLGVTGPFEQSAATGNPGRATAFKGERLLAARADDMVTSIMARWPDLRP